MRKDNAAIQHFTGIKNYIGNILKDRKSQSEMSDNFGWGIVRQMGFSCLRVLKSNGKTMLNGLARIENWIKIINYISFLL